MGRRPIGLGIGLLSRVCWVRFPGVRPNIVDWQRGRLQGFAKPQDVTVPQVRILYPLPVYGGQAPWWRSGLENRPIGQYPVRVRFPYPPPNKNGHLMEIGKPRKLKPSGYLSSSLRMATKICFVRLMVGPLFYTQQTEVRFFHEAPNIVSIV